jgi:hypothetical protein
VFLGISKACCPMANLDLDGDLDLVATQNNGKVLAFPVDDAGVEVGNGHRGS